MFSAVVFKGEEVPFTQSYSCELTISDLRLWVRLGCSQEEKHNPQLVSIRVQVLFGAAPVAMETDHLEDTFCYQRCVESIEASVKGRSFNLIEHMAKVIYDAICPQLRSKQSLVITMTKMSPPVPGIHGGVSFRYSS